MDPQTNVLLGLGPGAVTSASPVRRLHEMISCVSQIYERSLTCRGTTYDLAGRSPLWVTLVEEIEDEDIVIFEMVTLTLEIIVRVMSCPFLDCHGGS